MTNFSKYFTASTLQESMLCTVCPCVHTCNICFSCRGAWEALGPPAECLGFDFYDSAANMQPASAEVALPITQRGICNAMALWFDLHLDEQTTLSTGPYALKVRHKCRTEGYFHPHEHS